MHCTVLHSSGSLMGIDILQYLSYKIYPPTQPFLSPPSSRYGPDNPHRCRRPSIRNSVRVKLFVFVFRIIYKPKRNAPPSSMMSSSTRSALPRGSAPLSPSTSSLSMPYPPSLPLQTSPQPCSSRRQTMWRRGSLRRPPRMRSECGGRAEDAMRLLLVRLRVVWPFCLKRRAGGSASPSRCSFGTSTASPLSPEC
jgi:hypothetical protein